MKKHILILVVLLIAATSFAQPSRRTTNDKKPAGTERRVENKDNKSKPAARKADTQNRNKSTYRKPGVTRSRESTPSGRTSVNKPNVTRSRDSRPDSKPSGNKVNRPDSRPSGTNVDRPPRSNYSSSDRRQPVNDRPARTGVGNNDRPDRPDRGDGPRERKPTHKPESRPVNDRYKADRPVQAKDRPPMYHSSRKFVEHRPIKYHYERPPRPRKHRARWYPYRKPHRFDIYWSIEMRHNYFRIYPSVKSWRYPIGYRIPTISAYNALYYNGEVMNVYGKVYEVFYSGSTDEYFLYFGAYYPYHDFTVVMPGWIARRFNSYPEEYFEREHIIVTGLITSFNDSPEIVVKEIGQLRVY